MNPQPETRSAPRSSPEAGFTLMEALIATVILIFGLMAVSNLLLVATSSTSVANQSTAASVAASEVLEIMRSAPWPMAPWPWGATPNILTPGGDLVNDQGPTLACETLDQQPAAGPFSYNCNSDIAGVGRVHARWLITAIGVRTIYVQVQAEGTGALSGARSRASFSMFRTCTEGAPTGGGLAPCPTPPVNGGL